MNPDVYAFGSALVDIQATVDDRLLMEIGVEKGNMFLTDRIRQEEVLKRIMSAETLDLDSIGSALDTAAGGSAANTVYGISQLGGMSALCGKVADDGLGRLYVDSMNNSGVTFSHTTATGMTGSCVVLVTDDAQRTMLTCLGVSSEIGQDDIDEGLLSNASYVYIEGYLFDSPLATQTILHAIGLARKNGVRVALTASDAFCIERHRDIFLSLIENEIDLLFANAQEAQAVTGKGSLGEACTALSAHCSCAVTDGPAGSVLCFDGRQVKIPAFSVEARDTTGAGDAYAAGLLFGLTHNYPLETCGRLASFFASRVVAQTGPRYCGDIWSEIPDLGLEQG